MSCVCISTQLLTSIMASRRSDILPCQRNSDPSSADEMPKVPHQPLLQKLIKCDVPDISVVSDAGSEAGTVFDSGRHRRISYPRVPILHSKCNGEFPTEGTSRTECQNKIHCKDVSPSEMSNKNINKQHLPTSKVDSVSKDISENSPITEKHSKSPAVTVPPVQSPDAWEYFKRQDEKLDAIQEQVSRVLAQNQLHSYNPSIASDQTTEDNLPALQTGCKDTGVSPTGSTCLSAHKEELLIKCLLAQSEQIQKLQEQVNWLLLKTTEQLSLNTSGNERTAVSPQCPDIPSITSNRNPAIFEGHQHRLLEVANKQSDSVETAMCHQETEVTKQSTSTMTSLTFNGNDKFVIHKKLTVVTDSSKYQKEVSAQCSYTKNGVASPEKPVATKNIVSSAKRSGGKARKSTKCSTKCNCSKKNRIPSSSSDVVSPDDELIQPSPTRNESPLMDAETQDEQRELQNMESKIEKYIPNYENILKNVNEMILENTTEHRSPPPAKNTTPKSTSRPRDKHASVPKTVKSPNTQIRKEESKRLPGQRSSSTSSNTSINSVQGTSEYRKPRPQRTAPSRTKPIDVEEEFSTASRYGLSSPNLSVATKQYLENYGLVQDQISDSERIKSSRKTRTSLSKRYPR